MIRIAVVSDTHGQFRNVGRVRTQLGGRLDWLLHAGDHMQDAERVAVNLGISPERVRAVAGNCDGPHASPEAQIVEVGGVKILLTHGHRDGVKEGLQRIRLRAQEAGARVAVFGHSHIAFGEDVGGVLLFNPGSLTDPRREGDTPSCGLLTIENGVITATHFFVS